MKKLIPFFVCCLVVGGTQFAKAQCNGSNSPTFEVVSTPTLYATTGSGGYSVGCNNHSMTVLNIINVVTNPPGNPAQFCFTSPGGSQICGSAQFTVVSTPGTWTVGVYDVGNACLTSTPVTIVQNTLAPDASVLVPTQILDCFTPSTALTGQSSNSNVFYTWSTPSFPFPTPSQTVAVNTNTNISNILLGNYTLTVIDLDNGCISNSVIPMQQNLFPPIPNISAISKTLTCVNPTLQLTNASQTGIPPISGFPTNHIIQVQLWEAPSPQPTLSLYSSYVASVSGVYTMTVKDLNNGCTSHTTITIYDGKEGYPVVNHSVPFVLACGASNTSIYPTVTSTLVYMYQWTAPPTNTFIGSSTTKTVNVTALGIYTVEVTNPMNGCSTQATMEVVPLAIFVNISINNSEGYLCVGNTSELTAQGATTYTWSTNETASSITVSPSGATIYSVIGTCAVTSITYSASITAVDCSTLVGIQELSNNTSQIKIYPNPAGEELKVECLKFKEGLTAIIYNVLGNEIVHSTLNSQLSTIDVSELPKGIYFIKIGNGTHKFVKQ